MTNDEIRSIAMRQSAIDMGCDEKDFLSSENRVVLSRADEKARKYLTLPFYCDLVSYGNNIVASVNPDIAAATELYINKYSIEHCFETPNLYSLNKALAAGGMQICFMAEYFLPDMRVLGGGCRGFEIKLLEPCDFAQLYTPQWGNALCERRRSLDVLAAAVYDGGTLVGLAGAAADCDTMWQIGVDVLPQYRRRGIASALTAALAQSILKHGRVPYYCAAWSNIGSVNNAIKSGFRPAWAEITAKSAEFVRELTAK